jgi:hypothetical protein
MTEHTATPWHCTRGYIASDSQGFLPLATPFAEGANQDKHGGPTPEAKANAAFIVKAVNERADMLEVIEEALFVLRNMTTKQYSEGEDRPIRKKLAAVLAKAQEKQDA